MKRIQKIFISGLISFLPLAITIYVVYAVINLVEDFLGIFLKTVLPQNVYIPGFGFLATILLIFLLGLLLNNFVTASLFHKLQEKLAEVPLVKVVYSPLRDLVHLFSKNRGGAALQKVVLVQFDSHKEVLGLVTREHFNDLDRNLIINPDKLAVYIPMSYGLGGYTVLVNKSQVTAIDMPVEKAMSLALTGWIKTDSTQK